MTTTLPANVTIVDLPSYTTVTGGELFEAVQTQGGVALSVQIPMTAIMTSSLGALPTGGATGNVLVKTSGTNFAAGWGQVDLSTSAGITGTLGIPYGGWGTPTIQQYGIPYGNGTSPIGFVSAATAAYVLAANGTAAAPTYQALSSLISGTSGVSVTGTTAGVRVALATQAGLSVLGVTAAASAIPAAIVGTAGQVLAVNAGATGLAFTTISISVPTPWSETSITQFGVVYGMGTSQVSATLAGTTTWPLVGNGTGAAPTFQVLTVLGGGLGTSAVGPRGVLVGGTTATSFIQFASVATAGAVLLDQGISSNPTFRVAVGDLSISALGTFTIGTNVVSYAKIQQGTGLSVMGVAGTAVANFASITGGTGQILGINLGGTTLGFIGPGQTPGVQAATAAATGVVGEFIGVSVVATAALTSNVAANITAIVLSPGDWDVTGIATFTGSTATVISYFVASISTTNATSIPDAVSGNSAFQTYGNTTPFNLINNVNIFTGPVRLLLNATTTTYLNALSGFATSTCSVAGYIRARRMR